MRPLVLLAVVMLMAGCGQPPPAADPDGDDGPATSSSTTAPAATASTSASSTGSKSASSTSSMSKTSSSSSGSKAPTAPVSGNTSSPPAAVVGFAPAWGPEGAPLRPGSPIGWCTWNWLFWAPNGTYYIGTAAHCTDELGQRMPLVGFGDVGTVVYDSDVAEPSGANADFSLILLDHGINLQAYPGVVNRVGPVGAIVGSEAGIGDVIEHHGYGLVFGDLQQTRDRDGILVGFSGGASGDYCSESPIWWGDSGSPVLHADTHKALGIVSRAGWIECIPTSQLMGATMDFIFAELERHGWGDVELATTA